MKDKGYLFYSLEHGPHSSPRPELLYFGVEFEALVPVSDSTYEERRLDALERFIQGIKSTEVINNAFPGMITNSLDWSISGGFAREFQTAAATEDFFRTYPDVLTPIFSLKDFGFICNRSCGQHFHFSLSPLEPDHIKRCMEFVYSNPKQIIGISGRKMGRGGYYSRASEYEFFDKEKVLRQCERKFGEGFRAPICIAQNTMEIRFFAGTLDHDTTWKNLEFCAALIEFTKDSLPSFDRFVKMANDTDRYKFLQKLLRGE